MAPPRAGQSAGSAPGWNCVILPWDALKKEGGAIKFRQRRGKGRCVGWAGGLLTEHLKGREAK
ncbi:hypothetical protein PABG_11166 [Paracoccidioides brasiliensis Pb03]|nr:hypothetical protein PABG_11166 [Paracoccidioides brasiliensis Pb03]